MISGRSHNAIDNALKHDAIDENWFVGFIVSLAKCSMRTTIDGYTYVTPYKRIIPM